MCVCAHNLLTVMIFTKLSGYCKKLHQYVRMREDKVGFFLVFTELELIITTFWGLKS